jgi:hypothetical protein
MIHWELSNTMEVGFCKEVLEESLSHRRPVIFNADQGSQVHKQRIYVNIVIKRDTDIDGW